MQIRCRNKIVNGEELEALIPKQDVCKVTLTDFVWKETSQTEVNRPGEIYTVTSSVAVPSGSFLRKREERTTSRMVK